MKIKPIYILIIILSVLSITAVVAAGFDNDLGTQSTNNHHDSSISVPKHHELHHMHNTHNFSESKSDFTIDSYFINLTNQMKSVF